MQKTENFGFNKPEPYDLMDVAALNENFDIADRELKKAGGTYDVDLSQVVNVDTLGEEQTFTVTDSVDLAAIRAAVEQGKTVRVKYKSSFSGSVSDVCTELTQVLQHGTTLDLTNMGLFVETAAVATDGHLTRLNIYNDVVSFVFRPVAWSNAETENAPTVTAISVTEADDGTVTMVNTLEGGGVETLVLTPDESGNPSKLTYNGTEIPITWTEATAEESSAAEEEAT